MSKFDLSLCLSGETERDHIRYYLDKLGLVTITIDNDTKNIVKHSKTFLMTHIQWVCIQISKNGYCCSVKLQF